MHITIETRTFREAFSKAAAVAPAKTQRPILRNVKLDVTSGGTTTLTATDTERTIVIPVEGVEVRKTGSVLLPVKFGQVLKHTVDGQLAIKVDAGGKITITGENSKTQLATESVDEFPGELPLTDDAAQVKINGDDLHKAIDRTVYAIDDSGVSNYALGGILFTAGGSLCRLAATDGRRVAIATVELALAVSKKLPETVIIPAASAKMLAKLIGDSLYVVHCSIMENSATFTIGQPEVATVFSTRLVEGRFPKVQDYIDDPRTEVIEIPVGPLAAAVTRVSLVTDEESPGIDFHFHKDHRLVLDATAYAGTAEETVKIACGIEQVFRIDHRFVTEALAPLDPQSNISLQAPAKEGGPIRITAPGHISVIMPLSRS